MTKTIQVQLVELKERKNDRFIFQNLITKVMTSHYKELVKQKQGETLPLHKPRFLVTYNIWSEPTNRNPFGRHRTFDRVYEKQSDVLADLQASYDIDNIKFDNEKLAKLFSEVVNVG